jgi:hypothetical protein
MVKERGSANVSLLSSLDPAAASSADLLARHLRLPVEFHEVLARKGPEKRDLKEAYELAAGCSGPGRLVIIISDLGWVRELPPYIGDPAEGNGWRSSYAFQAGEGIIVDPVSGRPEMVRA